MIVDSSVACIQEAGRGAREVLGSRRELFPIFKSRSGGHVGEREDEAVHLQEARAAARHSCKLGARIGCREDG
jgi:hypothetical protein